MTVGRGCMLLGVFAALALGVVHLRGERTRCAAAVLRIESDWVRLRGDLWGLQTRIARMRAPDRIHDRATYLATGLLPPGVRAVDAGEKIEKVVANDSARRKPAESVKSTKTKPNRRKNPKRE